MKIDILRRAYLPEATLSMVSFGDVVLASLEPPWQGNAHLVSCIPVGEYTASWYDSPLKGRVLRLANVPGRQDIEIHTGNFPSDTEGCILVGKAHIFTAGRPAIAGSAIAMATLRQWADGAAAGQITVSIRNYVGGEL